MYKKFNLINLFFVVVFLFSTQPGDIYSLDALTRGNYFAIVPIVFSVFLCYKYKISFISKKLLLIYVILFIWSLIVKTYDNVQFSPYPFIEVYLVDVALRLYRDHIIDKFVKCSVILSLISFIPWILTCIFFQQMTSIAKEFGTRGAETSYCLYLFSIPISSGHGLSFLVRNCGYSWEPGRYACFLIIAFYFHIMKNGLNWKNKSTLILTFALLSSQSTTGFFLYSIICIYYYVIAKKIKPLYIVAASVLSIASLSLPFMQEKIETLFVDEDDIEEYYHTLDYEAEYGDNSMYCPQRFEGFMYQIENFKHAPKLYGEGRNYNNFYLNRHERYNLVLSEGILGIFVRFGLIIGLLLYNLLLKSSIQFSRMYKNKYFYLFATTFIIMNFSYYLWESILCLCFVMYSFFINKTSIK